MDFDDSPTPFLDTSSEMQRDGSLARFFVARLLPRLAYGRLRLVLPSGECLECCSAAPGPRATIVVSSWRALWRICVEGELGLARSYIEGGWSTPSLDALFALGVANEKELAPSTDGSLGVRGMAHVRHWLNANTKRGSRRNIAAHYDLGNAFYSPWLDAGMNYSSGLFHTGKETLEEAQAAKIALAADMLELRGDEHVLEIGCGWGSMAECLVRSHCRVTALTLSQEQLAYARKRLASLPASTFDLRLEDYRETQGSFDRIVSIEMLEAVGERYWPLYFKRLRDMIRPDGAVVLQVITITERDFAQYRQRPDFIQSFVFPGGMLPTIAAIRREAARAGFEIAAHRAFGPSYVCTLREWRNRFLAAWPDLECLGFDQRFKRLWTYYLAYCEMGFTSEKLDVGTFKLIPI
ncbi:MAG: class I SAM-dependent methyltransferase [Methylobacteriaceae bacterium]|nr:class I SAM-dependent methyltransferase [Methylobacteriaceae bacterium]